MKRTKRKRKPSPVKLIAPMTVTIGDRTFDVRVVDRVISNGQQLCGFIDYKEETLYVSGAKGRLPDPLEQLAANLGRTLIETWCRGQEHTYANA